MDYHTHNALWIIMLIIQYGLLNLNDNAMWIIMSIMHYGLSYQYTIDNHTHNAI